MMGQLSPDGLEIFYQQVKLDQAEQRDIDQTDQINRQYHIAKHFDEAHHISLNIVHNILYPARMVPFNVPETFDFPTRLR